jgi:hypothetical protein
MQMAAAEEAHQAIQRFLSRSRTPVMIEPGEGQIALIKDSYHVEFANGRLTLQAWDKDRNIVRKVTGISEEKAGRLDLLVERFGKRTGTLQLLDLARPQVQAAGKRGARLHYREIFGRSLSRQFPGWTVSDLTTEQDLQHSLSPVYPRAFLKKGTAGLAALGAAPDIADPSGVLSFGLIWLDYLRKREPKIKVGGLVLFLPVGQERTTCLRLLYLDPLKAQFTVFVYSAEGYEQRVDLKDYGNLDTQLPARRAASPLTSTQTDPWIARLCEIPGVEAIDSGDGSLSLRVRGMEFARRSPDAFAFGLETKSPVRASNLLEVEGLARHLSSKRNGENPDRRSLLYQSNPEQWLESQVRGCVQELDASLAAAPIYGQVPAFAGGDRGVIDLLAAETNGRLTLIELKASEDIHLPLQALDYWMRVNWHVDRSEFTANGYFPGIALVKRAPRMLLVAPALNFHPTSEIILGYFSPSIDVERMGVSIDWRRKLQVVFRLQGAAGAA